MAERKITQAQVQALHDRCGLPANRCVAALRKFGPGVERTLEALIDEGIIGTAHLDPFLCSTALYTRAKRVGQRSEARRRAPTARFDAPALPRLTFRDFAWTGRDGFPEWGKAKVEVNLAPPGDEDDDPPPAPARQQVAAYGLLKSKGPAIAEAVLKAVFKRYPRLREVYGYDDASKVKPQVRKRMPDLRQPAELRKLIRLDAVHISSVAKAGRAYVGFAFRCPWDDEHGLGVLTHETRVIEVGDASLSFDSGAAEDDGGTELAS